MRIRPKTLSNERVETFRIAGLRMEKLTLAKAQRTQRQEELGIRNYVLSAREIDSDLGGLARANPDEPSNHAEQF